MTKANESLSNLKEQYSAVRERLALIENLYRGKMEEKRRKEEEELKRKRLEQERDQKIDTLNKAAEWVQAHYRGLITRRAYNKKGKKGKGKKKKK
jgi:small-conductance mechanosensitive channel